MEPLRAVRSETKVLMWVNQRHYLTICGSYNRTSTGSTLKLRSLCMNIKGSMVQFKGSISYGVIKGSAKRDLGPILWGYQRK